MSQDNISQSVFRLILAFQSFFLFFYQFTLLYIDIECAFMYCKCDFFYFPPSPLSSRINKDKAEDPILPEAFNSGSSNDETQVHKKQHTHSCETDETCHYRCATIRIISPRIISCPLAIISRCHDKDFFFFFSPRREFETLRERTACTAVTLCVCHYQPSMKRLSSVLIAPNILRFIDQRGRNVLLSSHKPLGGCPAPLLHIKMFHSTFSHTPWWIAFFFFCTSFFSSVFISTF